MPGRSDALVDPPGCRAYAAIAAALVVAYESEPAIGDDSGPEAPDASSNADTSAVIDLREVQLVAHTGERYVLLVSAKDSGNFSLTVGLDPRDGSAADRQELRRLAIGAGRTARFAIEVREGKLRLTRADDSPPP